MYKVVFDQWYEIDLAIFEKSEDAEQCLKAINLVANIIDNGVNRYSVYIKNIECEKIPSKISIEE